MMTFTIPAFALLMIFAVLLGVICGMWITYKYIN